MTWNEGLSRVFSFIHPKISSGHASGFYPQPCPDNPRFWFVLCILLLKRRGLSLASIIIGSDSPQSNNSQREGSKFIHTKV